MHRFMTADPAGVFARWLSEGCRDGPTAEIASSNGSSISSKSIAVTTIGELAVRYGRESVFRRTDESYWLVEASLPIGEAAEVARDPDVLSLWSYHQLGHQVEVTHDFRPIGVVCMCSSDLRVAARAADEFLRIMGEATFLLFSGGIGTGPHSGANLLGWTLPEAEIFRDEAVRRGVPEHRIFVEPRAKNSGENVELSKALLEDRGLVAPGSSFQLLLVQKPFMERRAYATFRKVWPEPDVRVSSPPLSWRTYCKGSHPQISRDVIVNIMVGDLQRIRVYAESPRNFQIPQPIPMEVWAAYERLVKRGYDWNVIKDVDVA
jgi:uncharacterized SAM-binding protein YcdF (DUF218 family)